MSLSFFIRPLAAYAESHLPPAIYDALEAIFINTYALYLYLSDFVPQLNLPLQSLLPALISLITLFLALRSLWRSTLFAIRMAWWMTKWGVIIGGIAWMMGGERVGGALQQFAGGLAGRPFGQHAVHDWGEWMDAWLTSPTVQPRRTSRARSTRRAKAQSRRPQRADNPPTIFDSFEAHRAYAERREGQQGRAGQMADESRTIEQIYEQVQDSWTENGRRWWETVGRIAGFTNDREEESGRRRQRSSRQRTRVQ